MGPRSPFSRFPHSGDRGRQRFAEADGVGAKPAIEQPVGHSNQLLLSNNLPGFQGGFDPKHGGRVDVFDDVGFCHELDLIAELVPVDELDQADDLAHDEEL